MQDKLGFNCGGPKCQDWEFGFFKCFDNSI